jgi:DNA-binding transcriptional LysR family regulator
VRLTAAGEVFYDDIKRILAEYDESIQKIEQMKRDTSGTLRIGYLHGATHSFLSETYSAYISEHPNTETKLFLMEGNTLTAALEDNTVDIIYTMTYGDVNSSWYSSLKVYDDYYGALVNKNHRLASSSQLTMEDLAGRGEGVVLTPNKARFPEQYAYLYHTIKASPVAADLEVRDSINDANDMVSQVVAGECFSLAPSHLLFFLNMKDVRFIPIIRPYLHFNVSAIWKKAKETPLILDFINTTEKVASRLGTEVLRNSIS